MQIKLIALIFSFALPLMATQNSNDNSNDILEKKHLKIVEDDSSSKNSISTIREPTEEEFFEISAFMKQEIFTNHSNFVNYLRENNIDEKVINFYPLSDLNDLKALATSDVTISKFLASQIFGELVQQMKQSKIVEHVETLNNFKETATYSDLLEYQKKELALLSQQSTDEPKPVEEWFDSLRKKYNFFYSRVLYKEELFKKILVYLIEKHKKHIYIHKSLNWRLSDEATRNIGVSKILFAVADSFKSPDILPIFFEWMREKVDSSGPQTQKTRQDCFNEHYQIVQKYPVKLYQAPLKSKILERFDQNHDVNWLRINEIGALSFDTSKPLHAPFYFVISFAKLVSLMSYGWVFGNIQNERNFIESTIGKASFIEMQKYIKKKPNNITQAFNPKLLEACIQKLYLSPVAAVEESKKLSLAIQENSSTVARYQENLLLYQIGEAEVKTEAVTKMIQILEQSKLISIRKTRKPKKRVKQINTPNNQEQSILNTKELPKIEIQLKPNSKPPLKKNSSKISTNKVNEIKQNYWKAVNKVLEPTYTYADAVKQGMNISQKTQRIQKRFGLKQANRQQVTHDIAPQVRVPSKEKEIELLEEHISYLSGLQVDLLNLVWEAIYNFHQILRGMAGDINIKTENCSENEDVLCLSPDEIAYYNRQYSLVISLLNLTKNQKGLSKLVDINRDSLQIFDSSIQEAARKVLAFKTSEVKDIHNLYFEVEKNFLFNTNMSNFIVHSNAALENLQLEQIIESSKGESLFKDLVQSNDPDYQDYNHYQEHFSTRLKELNPNSDKKLLGTIVKLHAALTAVFHVKASLWLIQKWGAKAFAALFGKASITVDHGEHLSELKDFCLCDLHIESYKSIFLSLYYTHQGILNMENK